MQVASCYLLFTYKIAKLRKKYSLVPHLGHLCNPWIEKSIKKQKTIEFFFFFSFYKKSSLSNWVLKMYIISKTVSVRIYNLRPNFSACLFLIFLIFLKKQLNFGSLFYRLVLELNFVRTKLQKHKRVFLSFSKCKK